MLLIEQIEVANIWNPKEKGKSTDDRTEPEQRKKKKEKYKDDYKRVVGESKQSS